jgi:hypothetical protein
VLDEENSIDQAATPSPSCPTLYVNAIVGQYLDGCYSLDTTVQPQQYCTRVKRTQVVRTCCDGSNIGEELSCAQFEDVESVYCYDVPEETLTRCSNEFNQSCLTL